MEIRNLVFGFILLLCFLVSSFTKEKSLALEMLTEEINTSDFDEIAPCVSPDGQTLYFTRVGYPVFEKTLIENGKNVSETHGGVDYEQYLGNIYSILAAQKIQNPFNSAFNQDIWIARSVDSQFDKIEHPAFPLNNALPNSVSTIDPTNENLIVINQFVEEGGMKKGFSKVGRDDKGNWTFPEAIEINNYHNSGPDVNVTMSKDGQVMIMALHREDSYGKSDLYVSLKNEEGKWSTPQNLGRKVNSPFREGTPHLSEDMKTLYFSSSRGRKGSDIFVQTRLDDSWSNWSAPKKFASPINSKEDDSHPYFNEATGYLYFTSKRNGSSDIFRVQIAEATPKGLMVKTEIRDASIQEGLNVKVIVKKRHFTESLTTYDGILNLNLLQGEKCLIIIEQEGYFDFQKEITFNEDMLSEDGKYALKLDLEPIVTGARFTLQAIQFKQSEAIVLEDSYPSLDKLSRFLKRNRNIKIQIAGHTDNVGNKNALLLLSEDRAATIKDYLVEKGVEASRLKTIGYGGKFPLNDNSLEHLKAKNRRVEIIISDDGE